MKELNEMTLIEVEERLQALELEVRESQEVEFVESATEEKRALLERKAELQALEQRKADALALQAGDAQGETKEKREEEKKMEVRTFGIDTEEYRSAWLKNLQGKPLDAEERAAITADAAIPEVTMNQIVAKLEINPLINAVDMTYIPSNVTYPVESSAADAAWVAMGTAATDSADALTEINLVAYKLIKTVTITADVAKMAISAFEAWLVERLANKIQKAVDNAILNGSGTNQATGILTTVSQTATYAKAGMTYANLMAMIAALNTEYLANATFVMPRATFFGEVLGLVDSQKNPVVVADVQSPAKYNILGFKVIVDDNCPADTVIFGDLKNYKFNWVQAPVVTKDESVEFRTGSTCYRAMGLADGKVATSAAFKVFKKSTT